MIYYIINLLLILGLAWPLCIYRPRPQKTLCYLSITFGYMFLLSALRFNIGFDYYNYLRISQRNAALSWGQLLQSETEIGYTILDKLITTFTSNAVVFYGIMALIILLPVAWFIYRYSRNPWLSTLMYATLTFFYGSMNFIRQNIAASILLLSYRFLKERRIVPYMLLVALACCFHITAILMVPVYFFAGIRLNRTMLLLYTGVTLALYFTSEMLLNFVMQFIFTSYKDSIWINTGFSASYLVVPMLFLAGALAVSRTAQKRFGMEGIVGVNLMLYNAIIWLFITRHFIIERFALYVYIFALAVVPMLCECLRSAPEVFAERDALLASEDGNAPSVPGKGGKKPAARLRELNAQIREHQTYYWCAVAAVVIICLCYNAFGAAHNFHNVFPYTSYLNMEEILAGVQ